MSERVALQRLLIMLAPALLVAIGLFGLGLVEVFRQSLDGGYAELFRDREFQLALGLTLWIATASTAIAVVAGVAIAVALRRAMRGVRFVRVLLQAPLAIPHLVAALAVIALLAPSGLLARIAFALGLIGSQASVPTLVNDAAGIGIILAYSIKEVPFIALVATAALLRVDDDYDAIARTLGASPWQRFRHVTWPLIAPATGAGALMIFAYVFSAFEVPFLLGRTYPSMLSVVVQQRFMSLDLADRPSAMASALVLTVLAALVVRLYLSIARAVTGGDRPVFF